MTAVASRARPCHIEGMTDQARKKRPRDVSQRAKLIVDIATGEADDEEPKLTDAQKFARLGGLKGGKARAAKLTGEQRSEIARKAARARWRKRS